jgi:hypothetical protein
MEKMGDCYYHGTSTPCTYCGQYYRDRERLQERLERAKKSKDVKEQESLEKQLKELNQADY